MNILLTGASGFVGSALLKALESTAVVICRSKPDFFSGKYYFLEINECTEYGNVLHGVDVIIHCAGRTHIMKETSAGSLEEYRKVNTIGTLNLARQAAEAEVNVLSSSAQ